MGDMMGGMDPEEAMMMGMDPGEMDGMGMGMGGGAPPPAKKKRGKRRLSVEDTPVARSLEEICAYYMMRREDKGKERSLLYEPLIRARARRGIRVMRSVKARGRIKSIYRYLHHSD